MSKDDQGRLWHHATQYEGERLDVATVAPEPVEQFRTWFAAAEAAGLEDVNGMTLATVGADGRPHARIVLLKEVDERGFVFYTNYDSDKGRDLAAVPRAALCFWWQPLHRQVRVEGAVERVADAESDAYFHVRPRGSRLGAIASPQSRPLPDRRELEARIAALEEQYAGIDPPRPAHWGGFRVVPDRVEFWQGQRSRLHDRVVYLRDGGGWRRERIAP
jgi:pyridoxamine 5'-phosphate oxidase